MECSKEQFVQKFVINKFTTQFIITERKLSYAFLFKQHRSIITVEWVKSHIQWKKCQWQDDETKRKLDIYNNYTWTK